MRTSLDIIKKLKKTAKFIRRKKISEISLASYFERIEAIQNNGALSWQIILKHLLEEYLSSNKENKINQFNIRLAQRLLKNLKNNAITLRSLTRFLNEHHQNFFDDDLINLFGALFSIFNLYQCRLDKAVIEKFNISNVWKDYLEKEIEQLTEASFFGGKVFHRRLDALLSSHLLAEVPEQTKQFLAMKDSDLSFSNYLYFSSALYTYDEEKKSIEDMPSLSNEEATKLIYDISKDDNLLDTMGTWASLCKINPSMLTPECYAMIAKSLKIMEPIKLIFLGNKHLIQSLPVEICDQIAFNIMNHAIPYNETYQTPNKPDLKMFLLKTLKSYIDYTSYEFKVALLNRIMRIEMKFSEYDAIFSLTSNAYENDIRAYQSDFNSGLFDCYLANVVTENGHVLPNEIREHISSFRP